MTEPGRSLTETVTEHGNGTASSSTATKHPRKGRLRRVRGPPCPVPNLALLEVSSLHSRRAWELVQAPVPGHGTRAVVSTPVEIRVMRERGRDVRGAGTGHWASGFLGGIPSHSGTACPQRRPSPFSGLLTLSPTPPKKCEQSATTVGVLSQPPRSKSRCSHLPTSAWAIGWPCAHDHARPVRISTTGIRTGVG
jgi:hypothetical protein